MSVDVFVSLHPIPVFFMLRCFVSSVFSFCLLFPGLPSVCPHFRGYFQRCPQHVRRSRFRSGQFHWSKSIDSSSCCCRRHPRHAFATNANGSTSTTAAATATPATATPPPPLGLVAQSAVSPSAPLAHPDAFDVVGYFATNPPTATTVAVSVTAATANLFRDA